MLNAIIVDDEPHCCKTLDSLLKRYSPEVNVLATCTNGADALKVVQALNPDLVFLDVEMPKMNGFEMLEQLPSVNFHLIFVTSYDAYALKAIRFSAIDYLLKPLDREELQTAVQKVIKRMQAPLPEQLKIILEKIQQPVSTSNKIALPTMEGLQMISVESIISCEADDNYTTLMLKNAWIRSLWLECDRTGSPIRSGRSQPTPVSELSTPLRMLTGAPLSALTRPETVQPPKAFPTTPFCARHAGIS